jgi:DNA-binding CsgD family transcriptional regulator
VLTSKQLVVLERVVRGDLDKIIASDLACSEFAVEMHCTVLLRVAKVKSRADLVARFWMMCPWRQDERACKQSGGAFDEPEARRLWPSPHAAALNSDVPARPEQHRGVETRSARARRSARSTPRARRPLSIPEIVGWVSPLALTLFASSCDDGRPLARCAAQSSSFLHLLHPARHGAAPF